MDLPYQPQELATDASWPETGAEGVLYWSGSGGAQGRSRVLARLLPGGLSACASSRSGGEPGRLVSRLCRRDAVSQGWSLDADECLARGSPSAALDGAVRPTYYLVI
jgi:hypothetical protein